MSEIVDKKVSIQVRIDRGLHKEVTLRAKELKISRKELIEGFIVNGLGPWKDWRSADAK